MISDSNFVFHTEHIPSGWVLIAIKTVIVQYHDSYQCQEDQDFGDHANQDAI